MFFKKYLLSVLILSFSLNTFAQKQKAKTLDEALESTATSIIEQIRLNFKNTETISIRLKITTPTNDISEKVSDELGRYFTKSGIKVVNRKIIDVARGEIDFGMGEEADDNMAIGSAKFLTAQIVVEVLIKEQKGGYRLTIEATTVKNLVFVGSEGADIIAKDIESFIPKPSLVKFVFGLYVAPGTVGGTNGWQPLTGGALAGFNIGNRVHILGNAEAGIGWQYKSAVGPRGDKKEEYHFPIYHNLGGIFEIRCLEHSWFGVGGGIAGITNRAKILKNEEQYQDGWNIVEYETLEKEKQPSLSFPYMRGTISYYNGIMPRAFYDYNFKKNGFKLGLALGYLFD